MTCPHCKAPLTADARFCGACGKATAPTESDPSIPLAAVAELAGREIAGRYRILTKLGEGGMGAVYRGEQISLRRTVAVKLLRPELSANQTLLRRFSAEAEAVAKLSHPSTVNVYDFGQDTDGSLFIAMEYIEGRSLRDVVAKQGPLPPARALAIAVQVAASLADAHAHKIVHRDLKPDNVMLQERGRQRDVVRVLDFGIAKLRDDSRATQQAMTQAGDMLGTPQYMAPEQIKGDAIDGRCDVYALGCMIYEMVTARLPFEAPTIMAMLSKHLIEAPVPPSQRRPELGIPPAVEQLVMAAMAKDPAQRPPTMEHYGEQIAAVLATLPAPSAPVSAQAASAVASAVTPAPYSAPAPYVPPPIPPTTRAEPTVRAPAPKRGRLPLVVVLALVVLAGGGTAAYVATRPHHDPAATTATATPAVDPWNVAAPPPPPDPWSTSAPAAPAIGTAETPVPPGFRLSVPPDWQELHPDEKSIGYLDSKRNVLVAAAPLFAGTNDPKELAKQWETMTGAKLQRISTIVSAGAARDELEFTATVGGVEVGQVWVLYIAPAYRVGVIYQAPGTLFTDAAFIAELNRFYTSGVSIPQ